MITGARLSDILAFNRGIVQDEILKAASFLLDIDRRLAAMRLDEARAWGSYAGGNASDEKLSEAVEGLRSLAAARRKRVAQAIEAAREADVEASALRRPRAEAAYRLAEAKAAFELAEKAAMERAACDPETVRLREAAEAVRLHRKTVEGWMGEAFASSRPLLEPYDADPAFAYLSGRGFGTPSYKAGPLARLLDRKLARKTGYAAAAEGRAKVAGYLEAADGWIAECDARLAAIAARLQESTDRTMAEIDGPRSVLAAALNEEDAVSRRAEAVESARREAVNVVLQVSLGRDGECRAMTKALAALMAKERSSAMVRAAASPEGPDAAASAELDAIVRARIGLSMEADGLRMHLAGAAARLKAVEEVLTRLALRGWDSRGTIFGLDERTMLAHDLSMGRIGVDTAWTEIEEALENDPRTTLAA